MRIVLKSENDAFFQITVIFHLHCDNSPVLRVYSQCLINIKSNELLPGILCLNNIAHVSNMSYFKLYSVSIRMS